MPDSPAEHAGLKPGDIIRTYNGHEIVSATGLRERIAKTPIGSKVELGIIREGKAQTLATAIAEVPESALATPLTPAPAPNPGQSQGVPGAQPPNRRNNVLAGVEVETIPSKLRDALPQSVQGVVVTQLQPDSPAAERLRVGDIIEEFNYRPVRSPADFERLAQSLATRRPCDALYCARPLA